jgi:hypothetical protein
LVLPAIAAAAAAALAAGCAAQGGTTAAAIGTSLHTIAGMSVPHPSIPIPSASVPSTPDAPSVNVGAPGGTIRIDGAMGSAGTAGQEQRAQLDVGTDLFGTGKGGQATGETVLGGAPGTKVTVEIHNSGQSAVTVTMDGVHPDKVIQPGATTTVVATYPSSGMLHVQYR